MCWGAAASTLLGQKTLTFGASGQGKPTIRGHNDVETSYNPTLTLTKPPKAKPSWKTADITPAKDVEPFGHHHHHHHRQQFSRLLQRRIPTVRVSRPRAMSGTHAKAEEEYDEVILLGELEVGMWTAACEASAGADTSPVADNGTSSSTAADIRTPVHSESASGQVAPPPVIVVSQHPSVLGPESPVVMEGQEGVGSQPGDAHGQGQQALPSNPSGPPQRPPQISTQRQQFQQPPTQDVHHHLFQNPPSFHPAPSPQPPATPASRPHPPSPRVVSDIPSPQLSQAPPGSLSTPLQSPTIPFHRSPAPSPPPSIPQVHPQAPPSQAPPPPQSRLPPQEPSQAPPQEPQAPPPPLQEPPPEPLSSPWEHILLYTRSLPSTPPPAGLSPLALALMDRPRLRALSYRWKTRLAGGFPSVDVVCVLLVYLTGEDRAVKCEVCRGDRVVVGDRPGAAGGFSRCVWIPRGVEGLEGGWGEGCCNCHVVREGL
ncbi:hypothetical protein QBC39DRAFT_357724 [Podospora conica]|nr:hypothetical protein QBC39DRAFT_357724 [Schizothecium conicum]